MARKRIRSEATYEEVCEEGTAEQLRFRKLFTRFRRIFGLLSKSERRCQRLAQRAALLRPSPKRRRSEGTDR